MTPAALAWVASRFLKNLERFMHALYTYNVKNRAAFVF